MQTRAYLGAALALALSFGLTASSRAQVQLTALRAIDLSSVSNSATGFGANPASVAWNGSTAWVAGYNTTAATATIGIVPITSVLTAPVFGARFGDVSGPASRGFTGLALQGSVLAATVDTGAGSGDSVRAFDLAAGGAGTQKWRIGDAGAGNDSTRRGNGVAFDPGFNGAGTNKGVAYLSIGSGRRHLLDTTSGAYINGQNGGAIINFNPVSTTFRDLAFDPATGDLYTRESNRIGKAIRNGDNSFVGAASTVISPASFTTVSGVDNQNLAFVNALVGNFVIANNRSATGAGQAFTSVIAAIDTTGNPLALSYDFSAIGGTPLTGNGAYDFAFDAASQTLAMTDFSNRQLYIFRVGAASAAAPEPAALALFAPAGLLLLVRRRRREA